MRPKEQPIKMTLKEAEQILAEAGIKSARGEARKIFRSLGQIPEYELFSPRCNSESEAVADAIARRSQREPLQYILGEVDFYRETYKVTPAALIPREDTELLVEYAVKNLPRGSAFLDLCTGSGCVALSTLKNTEYTTAVAVDISDEAINLARENATRLGLCDRIELLVRDAMTDFYTGEIFAVLSNPPYVANDVYKTLEREIFFEPKEAFVGGDDGGDFYRVISAIYKEKISKDGFIAFEIGYDQRGLLEKIAENIDMSLSVIKDLSGNDRVAVLRRK